MGSVTIKLMIEKQASMRHTSSYQEDLAYIHHVGFSDFAANAAPHLLRILRRSGIKRGKLIDLACGSGIWARAAQRAGFTLLGVDSSPAMIRLARRVAPHLSIRPRFIARVQISSLRRGHRAGRRLQLPSCQETRVKPCAVVQAHLQGAVTRRHADF